MRRTIFAFAVFGTLTGCVYPRSGLLHDRALRLAAERRDTEVRRRVKGLPPVDSVEVYSLSDQADPNDPQRFEGNYEIVKTLGHKTLAGDDAQMIASNWRRLETPGYPDIVTEKPGVVTVVGSFSCFEPAYGLLFKRNSRVVLKTSVCWKCAKFTLPVFPFGNQEIDFNAQGKPAREMLRLVEKAVPLPRWAGAK